MKILHLHKNKPKIVVVETVLVILVQVGDPCMKVGIMVTKSDDSLFTDDTSQITESDSEWFF